MKTREEVTADKLRGGFYTPDALVDHALMRLGTCLNGASELHVLEPSAGDGAFIRGLARSAFAERIACVHAVELFRAEADRCRAAAVSAGIPARVATNDFLTWRATARRQFDAVVGNPPFVRFQFLNEDTKALATQLAEDLALQRHGVSNLWIPVLLGALERLRPGGVFALVVPAECFTGISAGVVRSWLVQNCTAITFDLFPAGSFPDVLQEVVILSGRREAEQSDAAEISVVEHFAKKKSRTWSYRVQPNGETWTRYLLKPKQLDVLAESASLPAIARLRDVARFEVAAVTGANEFFSVDQATIDRYDLGDWTRPLLPRIRHAAGLVYRDTDHQGTVEGGARGALLDFDASRPDPEAHAKTREYLDLGERAGLHKRYKTRIREPWYRVPLVRSEPLLLSKRSHVFPRVILNEVGVVTTDTIYRGWITDPQITERDFVAGFHNSLTLLSAEVEGRSFGGGVLELVPSEVSRLLVPVSSRLRTNLERLDQLARSSREPGQGLDLIDCTNGAVAKVIDGLSLGALETLEEARMLLAQRRFDRNDAL